MDADEDDPVDGLTYAADIGLNPPTSPGSYPTTFYARCGCGHLALASGTQDEAVAALDTHRTQSPTPEEDDQ